MIESVSLKDSIKDCWWVWVKRDILERMESTGNDERESEKEVESMQDKLFHLEMLLELSIQKQ